MLAIIGHTPEDEAARRLIRALGKGKDRAMTADTLARIVGTRAERTQYPIRHLARLLNELGYPVASCSKGFFMAECQSELREYKASLEQRKRGLDERITAIDFAIDQFDGFEW